MRVFWRTCSTKRSNVVAACIGRSSEFWLRRHLACKNLFHISGLVHVETSAEIRQLVRFPRLSLCVSLLLIGFVTLPTGNGALRTALRPTILWVALVIGCWAVSQFSFRSIYLKMQQPSSSIRYPKAEVEDLAKFSTLLATTGGIAIVFQQQAVFGMLVVLNIMAGIVLADFSAGLYEKQEIDQGITYVWLDPAYYSALKGLLQIQEFSFVAALVGLLVMKGWAG
jgi:hypothetical protein